MQEAALAQGDAGIAGQLRLLAVAGRILAVVGDQAAAALVSFGDVPRRVLEVARAGKAQLVVLGMGEGSELRRPLGVAIVGGLMISQFLTLYTTPIVYLALERLRRLAWRRRRTA